ncbi:GDSL esterase/lipase At5g03610-like [Mercurialis annua]|uniref:GDSL esterase/lipase At5g03610-like n=1 Tax=Mercurialis annua TaxID=3986 RepID=UPI0024AF4DC2|nr:GDSL esterase/lipase At5g03610-like [Mercurialis annua]
MEIKNCNLLVLNVFLLCNAISSAVCGHDQHHHNHHPRSVKLFVFGDSFLDTGNFNRSKGSWAEPYGITFPRKPSGRFSDGRVITDYIASYLGIKSPIPYKYRKIANKIQVQRGMNFAYGGSGVYETWFKNFPKLETQINQYKQLFLDGFYTKQDLANSVVLVSTSGNDYSVFLQKNGTIQNMQSFTRKLVKQIAKNLKQIHKLGVRKIAIAGIGPAGCFPQQTAPSSYKICNEKFNLAAKFHNHLLKQAVRKLNHENKKYTFVYLDFYTTFSLAINQHKHNTENTEYKNPLVPCCKGLSSKNGCGERDEKGEKKYVICKHPELSFFWDIVHPSQNGWLSIYLALRPTLKTLLL